MIAALQGERDVKRATESVAVNIVEVTAAYSLTM